MHSVLISVLIAGLALVGAQPEVDQTTLHHQLQVLNLLRHIEEPLFDSELLKIKNTYNPLSHLDKYHDGKSVQNLVDQIKKGHVLSRNDIFSLFDPVHRGEMIHLFEILYGAVDFETYYNTAVWARDLMNPRQFLYAFSVALLHRQDCKGIILPPAYEITPHMFVTTDVVRKAYQAKMRRSSTTIPMKFTGSVNNPEQRVAYFGEDIGMNAHHAHWHMDFPFWWKPSYNNSKDRKGELFFYMHHQLVARFDAERLSNGLPHVEPLAWDEKIVEGFAPAAMYHNGQEFPMRPDGVGFQDLPWITIHDLVLYEGRIRDAIAAGFIKTPSDEVLYLNNTQGIDLLGAIIESSAYSPNPAYYGQLHNDAHVVLSRVTDPQLRYGVPPGVMEHFETATRDPAFFRLHKHMDNLFKLHKDHLPVYTHQELEFPGVSVEAVKVVSTCKGSKPNNMYTYFDESNIDLGNAVQGSADVEIKAQVSRLSHEPYKYILTIHAEHDIEGYVRIYLTPKYDWFGQSVPLDTARWSMFELDRFPVKLRPGDNIVKRDSDESSVTISEPHSFPSLIAEVEQAINGTGDYEIDKYNRHCGFPHRLLLPKGTSEGMQYSLYVVVSDYKSDNIVPTMTMEDTARLSSIAYCGVVDGKIPDGKPMGYPFDRKIVSEEEFLKKNMKVIDVTINHVSNEQF